MENGICFEAIFLTLTRLENCQKILRHERSRNVFNTWRLNYCDQRAVLPPMNVTNLLKIQPAKILIVCYVIRRSWVWEKNWNWVTIKTLTKPLIVLRGSLVWEENVTHRNATCIFPFNVCLFIRDSERIKAFMRSMRKFSSQIFSFVFINDNSGTLKIK